MKGLISNLLMMVWLNLVEPVKVVHNPSRRTVSDSKPCDRSRSHFLQITERSNASEFFSLGILKNKLSAFYQSFAMSTSAKLLLKEFLSLFLRSPCLLCQRASLTDFCPTCDRQLQQSQLENPARFWQGSPAVFAWGTYQSSLKRAIVHLKYDNQPQIARPLGQWLAQSWLNANLHSSKLVVVPIPLHPAKQQQRGYNQAELIARSFCEFAGYSLQAHGLERVRSTEALFTLTPAQRADRLSQAFSLGRHFQQHRPSQPVLLLDDIYTTGATVKSAIQTLRKSGIKVCGVVTVAKAEKWVSGDERSTASQKSQTPDSDQDL